MTTRFTVALAAMLALAACGGGGGGGSASPPVDTTQVLTGSQSPQETVSDQSARLAGIIARTDSLVASTWYGETSHSSLPTFRARSSCSGTGCSFYESQTGLTASVDLDDLDFDTSRSKAVLSKHGITTIDSRSDTGRSYYSIMNYSAFSVENSSFVSDGTTVWSRLSYAGGDLTRSRPSGSATWTGLMVGTPATGPLRNNFLQGDAELTYGFSGSLDASFTNIKDITRNRDHSVSSVRFVNVPVSSSGTFSAGATGNRIEGGFYGSGHAETAGVFEQSGIVGAFGAKK